MLPQVLADGAHVDAEQLRHPRWRQPERLGLEEDLDAHAAVRVA